MSSLATVLGSFIFATSFTQSQDCVFTDSVSNEYTLDLSALNGIQLQYVDTKSPLSRYYYTYTVCANDLYCDPRNNPPAEVSINQFEPTRDECWWIAQWDDGKTQPSYDPATNVWSFTYRNGMECGTYGDRNITVNWHCNGTVGYEITNITETSPCEYAMNIESMYACGKYPYCKWFGNSGQNTLDLSALSSTTIIQQDRSYSDLLFVYTPCRNGTQCGRNQVMAKLENVTTSSGCDSYIGIWEQDTNGGEPTYDPASGIWRFVYYNGQKCDDLDSSFYVYWFCDEDVASYKVIKAEEAEPCLYYLEIASSLACR